VLIARLRSERRVDAANVMSEELLVILFTTNLTDSYKLSPSSPKCEISNQAYIRSKYDDSSRLVHIQSRRVSQSDWLCTFRVSHLPTREGI
jgi:hypothetical protein